MFGKTRHHDTGPALFDLERDAGVATGPAATGSVWDEYQSTFIQLSRCEATARCQRAYWQAADKLGHADAYAIAADMLGPGWDIQDRMDILDGAVSARPVLPKRPSYPY